MQTYMRKLNAFRLLTIFTVHFATIGSLANANEINITITGLSERTNIYDRPVCELDYDVTNISTGTIYYILANIDGWDDRGESLEKMFGSSLGNVRGMTPMPIPLGTTQSFDGGGQFETRCAYLKEIQFTGVNPAYCNIRMLPEDVNCTDIVNLTSSVEGLVVVNTKGGFEKDTFGPSKPLGEILKETSALDDQKDMIQGAIVRASEVVLIDSPLPRIMAEDDFDDFKFYARDPASNGAIPARYRFWERHFKDNLTDFVTTTDPAGQLVCLVASAMFSHEFFRARATGVQFEALTTSFTPVEIEVYDNRIFWIDADISTPILDYNELKWTGHPFLPFEDVQFVFMDISNNVAQFISIFDETSCVWPFVNSELLE